MGVMTQLGKATVVLLCCATLPGTNAQPTSSARTDELRAQAERGDTDASLTLGKRYAHGPGEIDAAFGGLIVHHEEIDSIFRAAIGDYGYLVRSKDLDAVRFAARYIQETA